MTVRQYQKTNKNFWPLKLNNSKRHLCFSLKLWYPLKGNVSTDVIV